MHHHNSRKDEHIYCNWIAIAVTTITVALLAIFIMQWQLSDTSTEPQLMGMMDDDDKSDEISQSNVNDEIRDAMKGELGTMFEDMSRPSSFVFLCPVQRWDVTVASLDKVLPAFMDEFDGHEDVFIMVVPIAQDRSSSFYPRTIYHWMAKRSIQAAKPPGHVWPRAFVPSRMMHFGVENVLEHLFKTKFVDAVICVDRSQKWTLGCINMVPEDSQLPILVTDSHIDRNDYFIPVSSHVSECCSMCLDEQTCDENAKCSEVDIADLRVSMRYSIRFKPTRWSFAAPSRPPFLESVGLGSRVAIVKTPSVECGIHKYSIHLAQALETINVTVEFVSLDELMSATLHDLQSIIVHHEYGMYKDFGWALAGQLAFLKQRLAVPIHLFEHTFFKNPSRESRLVVFLLSTVVDRVIVLSSTAMKRAIDVYGIAPRKLVLIPHGAPSFTQQQLKDLAQKFRSRYELHDCRILLTVGHQHREKDVFETVKAMSKIARAFPGVVHVIAGKFQDNDRAINLETVADDYGIARHVRILNEYLTEDLYYGAIAASEIVLMPSTDYTSNSGTLVDSLGIGIPVLAYKQFENAAEMINPQWLLPSLSFSEWIPRIKLLLDARGQALREKMIRAGKERVTRHAWPTVAQSMVNLQSVSRVIRVSVEGPLFTSEGFAKVDRALAYRLAIDEAFDVVLRPRLSWHGRNVMLTSDTPLLVYLRSLTLRSFVPDVVIRSGWVEDVSRLWAAPNAKRWIQIQPWEFRAIPDSWKARLTSTHLRQPDQIWVPSSYSRQAYLDAGVSPDTVVVVPNGVDIHRVERDKPLCSDAFSFLSVGTLIERKGMDILLDAFTSAFNGSRSVCLYIAEGPQSVNDALRQRIRQTPSVHLLGGKALSDEEMKLLYARADCLVQPFRAEGFGLPIAEAAAARTPVIATGVPPVTEYYQREHVLMIDAVETDSGFEPSRDHLTNLLIYAMNNPDKMADMAAKAQEHVERTLLWDVVYEKAREELIHC